MFKEMREIQSSSGSCDDRQKAEYIFNFYVSRQITCQRRIFLAVFSEKKVKR